MSAPLYRLSDLRLSLPDMTRKPLLGRAPRIEILNGLSFDIPRGAVLGIVGGSGSGKSTLGRAMVRLLRPTGGTITFDGLDITDLSDYGNTSAGSIPIALSEAVASGKVKKGDVIACAGFGAGLSWGSAIMRWG